MIFLFSSLPASTYPRPGFPAADKLVHVLLYAVLAALLATALAPPRSRAAPERSRRTVMLIALAAVIATLYGVTDELHQLFVPGRSSDVGDLLADAAGALIGTGATAALLRRRRRRGD